MASVRCSKCGKWDVPPTDNRDGSGLCWGHEDEGEGKSMADLKWNKRDLILYRVQDLAKDLLFYDRRKDEEIPRGVIDEEIEAGRIKIKRIVRAFREALIEGLDEEWFRGGL